MMGVRKGGWLRMVQFKRRARARDLKGTNANNMTFFEEQC